MFDCFPDMWFCATRWQVTRSAVWFSGALVVWMSCALAVHSGSLGAAEKDEAAATRLLDSVRVLAADDMEGRGVGTRGLDRAAEYIADQFEEIGLRTDAIAGQPYQNFEIPGTPKPGPLDQNRLVLVGPGTEGEALRIPCEPGRDFNVLAVGGSAQAAAPLVFVGYGITATDWKYDDYAGIDTRGKVVIILRKEPQQGDATSLFNGLQPSAHASFRRKIENAKAHGAAAVIVVNDEYELQLRRRLRQKAWREAVEALTKSAQKFGQSTDLSLEAAKQAQAELAERAKAVDAERQAADGDVEELIGFTEAGNPPGEGAMPVLFCRRTVMDPVVQKTLGVDLATLEAQIDQGPTPHSRELTGWQAECQSSVELNPYQVRNVVGVLEGAGGLANETIVIGAHYDHLGRGRRGEGEIHNGADDNASGTSGIIEIARRLSANQEESRRRLVFVAFAGEELGLLGSSQYVKTPPFPLENTVAMINLDMIGRLHDSKLTIGGTGSAAEFDAMIEELNQTYSFKIAKMATGLGPSDHASFYRHKVPVLFFYTGEHPDYHKPTDDVERINVDGMVAITDFVTDIVSRLDDAATRPSYRETTRGRRDSQETARPYLGCVPDASRQEDGVGVLSVVADGPAAQAGLREGDVVVKWGERDIRTLDDLNQALRRHKPGDAVALGVRRGSENLSLTAVLGAPR
jgi:hypothetical protein